MKRTFFTSESVTEGHPDKICDQISDAVLDEILKRDPFARVACETVCTTGMALLMGEISTDCYVDIPRIAREVITSIGYDRAKYGFDGNTCAVLSSIDEQSSDIARGINASAHHSGEVGAGDQGMMFGFACEETPTLMPMPIYYAHLLARRLAKVRKEKMVDYLRPDGKTQVTVEYRDGRPVRMDTIIISAQHNDQVELGQIAQDLRSLVIQPVLPAHLLDENTKILINPAGRFVIGGPAGDSGLTGRKLMVDTYGGYARHGGGAFSGKDPTKVDRSGAYAARYIAKNIVASSIASRCEVQLAYAIGVSQPVSLTVHTFGTGKYPDEKIAQAVNQVFDLRPAALIKDLDLRKPQYRELASYGQMGREDLLVAWEKTDRADELNKALSQ